MSDPSAWPRLTETLPHREPGRCAACGAAGSPLTTWREHDWSDCPEPRFVVLCRPCSDRLIEPHPRLYAPLPPHTPAPGAMPLCLDCRHRDGTRCACPAARANGGEGVLIRGPAPTVVHVYRRGPGQRSGWEKWYPGPATGCSGKEATSP